MTHSPCAYYAPINLRQTIIIMLQRCEDIGCEKAQAKVLSLASRWNVGQVRGVDCDDMRLKRILNGAVKFATSWAASTAMYVRRYVLICIFHRYSRRVWRVQAGAISRGRWLSTYSCHWTQLDSSSTYIQTYMYVHIFIYINVCISIDTYVNVHDT